MPITFARHEALKLRLVMTRQMTSLMDRAFLSEGLHLRRCTANWVRAWIDEGHVVQAETPDIKAVRAIDMSGRLLWMVRQEGKRDAYHSELSDPVEAMAQASEARAARRVIRQNWEAARKLRRDILLGRKRFEVQIEDAAHAGLCKLGTQAFLRRFGLGQVKRLPAFVVAVGSLVDDQALFAIVAAAQRLGVMSKPQAVEIKPEYAAPHPVN